MQLNAAIGHDRPSPHPFGKPAPYGKPSFDRGDRGDRDRGPRGFDSPKPRSFDRDDRGGPRPDPTEVAPIYVGLGRAQGIRAGDLVGAIANESNLSGREIGPIKISEHFSVVGVPAAAQRQVIEALKGTTIKGKKATARPYVE